jgi:hypothetical protein
MTPEKIRADVLSRPRFVYYENDSNNKIAGVILTCINLTEIYLWEKYKNKSTLYEKSTAASLIELSAGEDYGENSQIYVLNASTTPAIPSDLYQIKKLSIIGDDGLKTDSKSTYDTDTVEGSGLPSNNTAIGAGDVYHELIDEDDDMELLIVIGNTAAGSAPKLSLLYVPVFDVTSDDETPVQCPKGLFLSEFMPKFDSFLKQRLGTDGY